MKKMLFVGLLIGVLAGCSKQEYSEDWKPGTGDLTIQVDKSAIKQSEFFTLQFGGYADSILVYDGTVGHEYRFKDRTMLDDKKVAPDKPSHIVKTRFQNMMTSYRLGYKTPGQYKMTVLGKDVDGKEMAKTERDVTIQVN
ncbi:MULTISPECIES: DUF5017 domain-containing protein [Sphingobacterium]|uniref:DUF5017 domain-containing protein n=1 Tax=Sphingobacterium TaxID=28453 RepID=UPI0013DC0A34|nr:MULTISPECIES: DUF5017 domain-containing protein [unclassified Sphingobacterium]